MKETMVSVQSKDLKSQGLGSLERLVSRTNPWNSIFLGKFGIKTKRTKSTGGSASLAAAARPPACV